LDKEKGYMTNPIYSVFTVSVKFNDTFYDVEITPTLDDKPMPWFENKVNEWNRAESTHHIFSQTIKTMLEQSNIPAYLTTKGPLKVGNMTGITYQDNTNVADEETKKTCNVFIRYLLDPGAGIAAFTPKAEDEVDSVLNKVASVVNTGLGASINISEIPYLKLSLVKQKKVRLSLFVKKCREAFGLTFVKYKPKELHCRAHLLKHRPVVTTVKETIRQEIRTWFFHKYLLQADENEKLSELKLAQIDEERKEMARIFVEIKREAIEAAQESDEEARADFSDSDEVSFSEVSIGESSSV
jgi:hypothetical protein